MGQRDRTQLKRTFKRSLIIAALTLILAPAILYAAGSVNLKQPGGWGVNEKFMLRPKHPVTGKTNVPHRGVDYAAPCGSQLSPQPGGTLSCTTEGGYGGVGNVSYDCGVTEKYAHLQSCGGNSMVTGGGKGMKGAGTSTGCHLHYEIRINGVAVNPEEAYGQDLCNPDVQKQLIDSAQKTLNGQAGGGGGSTSGGGSNTGAPSGGSFEYVPEGSPAMTIPNGTGGFITVPEGGGYYIVTSPTGVVTIEPYNNNEGGEEGGTELPAVPPGTPPNLTPPGTGNGGEVTGCAVDTWTAMVNQAVLETRREMTINQRYIRKPDTVLAYSCFNKFIEKAGQEAGVFSETDRWVNKEVDILGKTVTLNKELGKQSLDGALVTVVMESYEAFIRDNFAHDFLGGTVGEGGGEIDQSYGDCTVASQIWQMAKCTLFTDEKVFYKFDELIATDPRKYPSQFACNSTGITQDMIDTAKNKKASFSKVDTYKTLLDAGSCADPIKTGVTVVRMIGSGPIAHEVTYPDAICTNPGCSYQSGGGSSGKCQVK